MSLPDTLQLTDDEFNQITKIVYDRIGIYLSPQKKTLVNTRIGSLLKKNQYHNVREYLNLLESDRSGQAVIELANHISTNHTFFNREAEHFELFRNICLKEMVTACEKKGTNDLRIWCCASSTGEEPIMIIMHMMESLGINYSKYQAGLLATDISFRALECCRKGVYHQSKFNNLSQEKIEKYFDRVDQENFKVKSRILKEIHYASFNLVDNQYHFKKPFHVIFCRNVMIYFDKPTKEAVLEKLHQSLATGGYLFMGHAESLNGLNHSFQPIKPSMYQKI